MRSTRTASVAISVLAHVVLLGSLAMLGYAANSEDKPIEIETVFVEEQDRLPEEFQQMEDSDEVADTFNLVSGSVSNVVGQSQAAQQTIAPKVNRVLDAPEVQVEVATITSPSLSEIADDLGEADIKGEVGAVVQGYGPALDRLTKELLRMLRNNRLTVVWLFDESESMKDDQQDLKKRLNRVYKELELAEDDPSWKEKMKRQRRSTNKDDILQTIIASYGNDYHVHTPRATSDLEALMAAIDRIPVDDTGNEHMCQALLNALNQYKGVLRADRKLVIIVVSDESGDDGLLVEDVRKEARRLKTPMYFLGREAVFGSLYAHVRWRQPETGRLFFLPIRRGPETPFSEQLQFDGLRRRRDSQMSGFGPYEQVRLARDTGGIFFQLPHEEADINDFQAYKLAAAEMREYLPSLDSRRDYVAQRQSSDFRVAIWDVIALLNPYDAANSGLELPEREFFAVNPNQSSPQAARRIQQVVRILGAMSAAQARLESVRELRGREPSPRWRANYDLLVAQTFAYRVRLFQYAIGLDQFAKTMPQRIKNKKSNRWSIHVGTNNLMYPDEAQTNALKVSKEDIDTAYKMARQLFAEIIEEHPNTPWSQRAEWEEKRGYGVRFGEHYFPPPPPPDPNAPPRPPRPKPTTPPKL